MSAVQMMRDSLMERLREAAEVAPAYYGDKIDSSEPVKKAFNLTHGDARALLDLAEADVDIYTAKTGDDYKAAMTRWVAALQRVRGE
jgi:hypothetical protein